MSGALPRAAVVLSGNELLDGRTRDTQRRVRERRPQRPGRQGDQRCSRSPTTRSASPSALAYSLAAEPDLLVVGGGLGTTHDDLTAACLARA